MFLYALPAAALPVIFHLFFRLRKEVRVFPTLMFFELIDPRLSSLRRIQEWLILALRCLIIALLMLALSQPVWLGIGQGRAAVILMIDNSGSMCGSSPDGQTKLGQALDAARSLLATLDKGDLAGMVLLVEDPLVPAGEILSSDLKSLKHTLDKITETEAAGTPAQALNRAFAMLEKCPAPRHEIHVFTDLQEAEWKAPPSQSAWPAARARVAVHRIASPREEPVNAALHAMTLPRKRLPSGRSFDLAVELVNTSTSDATLQLNATDDAGQQQSVSAALAAGGKQTIRLPFKYDAAGFHWISVWIEGDAFPADNKGFIGFFCNEAEPVPMVGNARDFGALPFALAPGGNSQLSGIDPFFVEPSAVEQVLARKPRVMVTTWNVPAAGNRLAGLLKNHVEAGGQLVLLPSAKTSGSLPEAVNWLEASLGPLENREQGFQTILLEKGAQIWEDLRDEKGNLHLRQVRVTKAHPLQLKGDYTVYLTLEDGRPLLASRRFGKGRCYVSGLAFDPAWSNLPLKAGFLAMAQNMVLSGQAGGNQAVLQTAGERLLPSTGMPEEFHLRSLAGNPLDWKGRKDRLPVLARTGVYLAEAGGVTDYTAVRSSEKEGIYRFVNDRQAPALAGLEHSIQTFTTREDLLLLAKSLRQGAALQTPLYLLVIAGVLLELWLANRPAAHSKRPLSVP